MSVVWKKVIPLSHAIKKAIIINNETISFGGKKQYENFLNCQENGRRGYKSGEYRSN